MSYSKRISIADAYMLLIPAFYYAGLVVGATLYIFGIYPAVSVLAGCAWWSVATSVALLAVDVFADEDSKWWPLLPVTIAISTLILICCIAAHILITC